MSKRLFPTQKVVFEVFLQYKIYGVSRFHPRKPRVEKDCSNHSKSNIPLCEQNSHTPEVAVLPSILCSQSDLSLGAFCVSLHLLNMSWVAKDASFPAKTRCFSFGSILAQALFLQVEQYLSGLGPFMINLY